MQHTSLSTSHEITATHDNGDRVLLDGSRVFVASKSDVGDEMVIERRGGELGDGFGNLMARSLDGDIVILVEIDTGGLDGASVRIGGTEELTLEAGVGRTSNVLAINPAAFAGTSARAMVAATTDLAGTAVGVGIEATTRRLRRRGIPAGSTALGAGSKRRSAAPSIGTTCRATRC